MFFINERKSITNEKVEEGRTKSRPKRFIVQENLEDEAVQLDSQKVLVEKGNGNIPEAIRRVNSQDFEIIID